MKKTWMPADPIMVQNARLQSKGHKLWLEILIFILLFFIAGMVEGILILIPTMVGLFSTPAFQEYIEYVTNYGFDINMYMDSLQEMLQQVPTWVTLCNLFATIGIIVTAVFYCTKIEKRKLSTLGLTKKKIFSEYGLGLGIGFLMFAVVIGLNLLVGGVKFDGVTFRVQILPMLLITLIGFMLQGASEEILCRGYLCVSVSRWMPLWVGILVNSLAFAFLHLMNPGVSVLAIVNIFLFGVFMTVYMIRRGNLWGVCAIHSIWNFTQGNIFKMSVSGMNTGDSVIKMRPVEDAAIWNGGAFGPEGGLCVTIVLVAAILVVLLFCKNKDLGQKMQNA